MPFRAGGIYKLGRGHRQVSSIAPPGILELRWPVARNFQVAFSGFNEILGADVSGRMRLRSPRCSGLFEMYEMSITAQLRVAN